MPTLYRRPHDPQGEAIQNALEEMVVQHEVVIIDAPSRLPDLDAVTLADLPVLVDDGVVYAEPERMQQRLGELRQMMEDWDRFQSDACYIDDDGRLCGHESVQNEDGPGMSANPALQPE